MPKSAPTVVTKIYQKIWIGFGFSMVTMIFLSILYGHSPTAFILILMALALFLSGSLLNFKPLFFGSLIFIAASFIYTQLNSGVEQALLYGISVLLGYIIPGMLLQRIYKKNTQ